MQTVHHLNSQECAWAFLRKKTYFLKRPNAIALQHENALWKKSGKRHAMIKKIGLRKELALEDRSDGDEHKNTGELLIEKKVFQAYIIVHILWDLLHNKTINTYQYHEKGKYKEALGIMQSWKQKKMNISSKSIWWPCLLFSSYIHTDIHKDTNFIIIIIIIEIYT